MSSSTRSFLSKARQFLLAAPLLGTAIGTPWGAPWPNSNSNQVSAQTLEKTLDDNVMQAEAFGANDPRLADALVAKAEYERLRKRLTSAEALYRRAFTIYTAAQGASSPGLLAANIGLAATLRDEQKYGEAEYFLRNALVVSTQRTPSMSLGGQMRDINIFANNVIAHPDLLQSSYPTSQVLDALAELFLRQNRLQDAQRLYERALIMDQLPETAPAQEVARLSSMLPRTVTRTLINTAEVYKEQGMFDQAEHRLLQALTLTQSLAEPLRELQVLAKLADVCRGAGRSSDAAEYDARVAALQNGTRLRQVTDE